MLPVFDTSSAGAPLDVAVRHLVVSAPDQADGSRDVLDIVQVSNPGTTTKVERDSAPTWRMLLPRGIEAFRVGEGDVPASAVTRVGDSLLVRAPFPPGVKQVVVIYVVPQGMKTLRVPVDQPTAQLEVLVEDSLANATGAALASANPLEIQGRTFRHFSSTRVVRGETAEISLRRAGRRAEPGLARHRARGPVCSRAAAGWRRAAARPRARRAARRRRRAATPRPDRAGAGPRRAGAPDRRARRALRGPGRRDVAGGVGGLPGAARRAQGAGRREACARLSGPW